MVVVVGAVDDVVATVLVVVAVSDVAEPRWVSPLLLHAANPTPQLSLFAAAEVVLVAFGVSRRTRARGRVFPRGDVELRRHNVIQNVTIGPALATEAADNRPTATNDLRTRILFLL